jgi:RHS repeat-associated protein
MDLKRNPYHRTTSWNTPYTFSGKEKDAETGYGYVKKLRFFSSLAFGNEKQVFHYAHCLRRFGARYYDSGLSIWLSVDPMSDKYPSMSPYNYCANNPVMLVDPDGMAWKPTQNSETGEYTGYEWIDPSKSYNADGSLKEGLYEQAIFFSDNGTYDSEKKYNMGSSTATVYKADGTTQTFQACTDPSNPDKYPTVPAGLYEAKVGLHQGKYTALRMGKVELGEENPAYSDGRTYANGINIHKPGLNNLTGLTKKGNPCSAGCLLIDIKNWNNFINIFNNTNQKNNKISIIVSRTMKAPTNSNSTFKIPSIFTPMYFEKDNTRVNTTIINMY